MRVAIFVMIIMVQAMGTGAIQRASADSGMIIDIDPVDALVDQYFTSAEVPGLAVLVVKHDKVVYQRTTGVANLETGTLITPDANFRLASITKHFTALAALMLSDWGKLDLDAPLTMFFDDFPAYGDSITPRMLIYHSSGLLDYESQSDLIAPERVERLLSGQEQLVDSDVLDITRKTSSTYFTPGTEFRYSNTGYALLALLVEQASGLSFPQFLKRHIFSPLGMASTLAYAHDQIAVSNRVFGHSKTDEEWQLTDQNYTSAVLGDGGIYSSLADLRKWFAFLLGNNQLKLSRDAYREYFSAGSFTDGSAVKIPHEPGQSDTQEILRFENYGYGWFIGRLGDAPLYSHGGGTIGFRNMLAIQPERQLAIVLLTNRNSMDKRFLDKLFRYFLDTDTSARLSASTE